MYPIAEFINGLDQTKQASEACELTDWMCNQVMYTPPELNVQEMFHDTSPQKSQKFSTETISVPYYIMPYFEAVYSGK